MKLLFIFPAILVGPILAQAIPPSVYVLMPNDPTVTALSSALKTLGYSHSELDVSVNSNAALEVDQKPLTYTILPPGAAYKNIARADPNARFILPMTRSTVSSWFGFLQTQIGQEFQSDEYIDSIRAFFANETFSNGKARLLELDVFPPESHAQAETWVALCDFVGLGYSIVERLKLWRFPA
jgi:hypothetical protein